MSIPSAALHATRHDARVVTHSQPVRLHDPHGALLRVLEGTVWLTHDHSPFDLILEAGESWRIDDRKPALVMPCAPSRQARVVVEAPPAVPARLPVDWRARLRAWFGLAPAC